MWLNRPSLGKYPRLGPVLLSNNSFSYQMANLYTLKTLGFPETHGKLTLPMKRTLNVRRLLAQLPSPVASGSPVDLDILTGIPSRGER